MRARNIKPGFFKNELLGIEDPLVSILFIGLWCLADKAGRLEDRPIRIKAEIFPYRENLDINGYLTVLSRLGFIQRYVVDEKSYIQVINFEKHQHCHNTEKESEIPDISYSCSLTVKQPLFNGYNPSDILKSEILKSETPDSRLDVSFKKLPAKKPQLELPEFINQETWNDFVEMRKKIKKPMTDRAAKSIIKQLAAFHSSGENVEQILDNSIVNCWQGVFAPKKDFKPVPAQKQNDYSEFD